MKAVLVTKFNTRIEIEIKNYSTGVIVRNDTRKDPPMRIFHYVSTLTGPPEFYEVEIEYIGKEGLPDDVFFDSFNESQK